MSKPVISIVGLGKLGAAIAAVWGSRGHHVYGVDMSDRVIDMINVGEPPVQETDLDVYLAAARHYGSLTASKATAQAVIDSNVTFVLVPTPSHPKSKRFALDYVLPACEQIGVGIGAKDAYHTVVITSTVMPGSMGGPILRALETSSGKPHGQGWGLVYSPEFVALGAVIKGFLNPDFLLIGHRNPRDRDYVAELYLNVVDCKPPVLAMGWWNAETTKLALNGFMTVKISYANLLAEMCEGNPAGNVDAITRALACDTRIAPRYFTGGLSFGGPCFERDIEALGAAAQEMGITLPLPGAIKLCNDQHRYHLIHRVLDLTSAQRHTVGILGLAYKSDTPIIEGSAGVHLAETLCALPDFPGEGYKVRVLGYDPLAGDAVRDLGIEGMTVVSSVAECVTRADVLVVTVPWNGYHELEHLPLDGKALLDCWRMFDPERLGPGIEYVPYGLGKEAQRCEF
jgi:UDPglucose 6-dehydrogenase